MSRPRILVAEDEALVAADLAESLRDMGFEPVAVVPTGELAVKHAREDAPDLILMDIRLQGEMDGIQAATLIHEGPGCPVVFLTAYAEGPILERAKAAEPYGYLVKPVNLRELGAIIQMALYKAQMERERAELTRKLQQALDEVKTLSGLLPICANCKKIRDDSGYWQQIESYIAKHSQAAFTHGLCPECAKKLYPEI